MTTRLTVSIAVCLFAFIATLAAHEPATPKAPAPPKPKSTSNVTVLKDLSQVELLNSMNLIRASLGVNCDFCHVRTEDEWDFASDAKDEKLTAREMIAMVKQTNQTNFGGRPIVGCYTCHHGTSHPTSIPPLPTTPPSVAETHHVDKSGFPEASTVVAKYLKATGLDDPDRAAMDTRVLRGTRTDPSGASVPIEIVQSGERLLITATIASGELQQSSDGDTGWVRDKDGTRAMSPAEVERFAQQTASLELPPLDANAEGYRVVQKDRVAGRDVWVVERRLRGDVSERFAIDAENGLLLRVVRVSPLPVGRMPEEFFYTDYRDAGGLKVPFEIRSDFIDPRMGSVRKFESIDYNAKVDPARFEMRK